MESDRDFKEFKNLVSVTRARSLVYAAENLLAEAQRSLEGVPGLLVRRSDRKIDELIGGAAKVHMNLCSELYGTYGCFEDPGEVCHDGQD